MLLLYNEAYQIFMAVRRTQKINGDIAEVGIYMGGSAKLISEAKGNKILHLFDTFEGLPEISTFDKKVKIHMFRSELSHVKNKLNKYDNVHIYKGLFPETADSIKSNNFSFVHLDVDLYQSTKDCLEFFYRRMSKRGIILSHDYDFQGVRKAFNEFFRNKPEKVIRLPMSQCMIVKE